MNRLKKQIQFKEEIIALRIVGSQEHWLKLKTDFMSKLNSSHTLIWSGIGGFIIGEVFHPSRRNVLFTFWPLFKKVGQPLWSKLNQFIQPQREHDENDSITK
jgi:hypothetical protein